MPLKKVKKYKYINYKDNIADILEKYPMVSEVFLSFGLHCVGCFANSFDTVEAASVIHGMTEQEINDMLEEANLLVSEYEKLK